MGKLASAEAVERQAAAMRELFRIAFSSLPVRLWWLTAGLQPASHRLDE
ncbi:hypothetical protein [Streptomyces sp. NPDC059786]